MSVKNLSIDRIGLSVRSANALHRIKVHTVGDLMQYDEARLLQVRNLGQKSVQEIAAKIEEYKAREASGWTPAEPEREKLPEAVPVETESAAGKEQVLQWLREKQVRIDVLELLSARAYNLLMLNEREYLHQLAFRTKEELQEIPRMDGDCAGEIVKWVDAYIRENQGAVAAFHSNEAPKAAALEEMRFLPEYQESILEFVRRNDIPVEDMPLSVRPKNRLTQNGYRKLSDIIFLTEKQLKRLPAMGAASVEQIQEMIRDYLEKHEDRILAFCNGDASVLWDDTAIRKKLLRLYQDMPFGGFSLEEMTEKLELPEGFPLSRIKRVIGQLLAERKLEYVDFRCYRLYEKFAAFLPGCDAVDERAMRALQLRLQGSTLEQIAQEYGVTREYIRQIIKSSTGKVRSQYAMVIGDRWFDEDYYWYFYENYAFDLQDISRWLGIPESVWTYLDIMGVKQGKKELEAALDDQENLEIGLRLKVKNYLNRNKIFVDGAWVERKRSELERIVARKFCREDMSFEMFARAYNDFLTAEEIPYDEELYYTPASIPSRKNRLPETRFLLWKQYEMLRYYDIDSRDYTELLETLNLDVYENVEFSTLKFMREYPQLMEKYDIRDQYELHNLLRKIVPEGSFHDFHCGRMPQIRFGTFDRDAAILDILIEMAPVTTQALCERISEEYGHDPRGVVNYLQPFAAYYHEGVYTIDQKPMSVDRAAALHRMLPDDFYYMEEIRKIYAGLFPDADPEEINPYNLKSMGFTVLSHYVVQHYPSLEAYFEYLLTREDIVDLKAVRQRFTYVQMFAIKLRDLRRNLDVVEFEPGKLLHFRRLARAGVTKDDLRAFCSAVYGYVPDGSYFSVRSIKQEGFDAPLFDLGFPDWFYDNLLLADERFSYTNVYGSIILYKGKADINRQSFLVDRVRAHGWIDVYDLMTELETNFGCVIGEKYEVTAMLKNTEVYYDKILDRLYANAERYYRDLEETGGF